MLAQLLLFVACTKAVARSPRLLPGERTCPLYWE